MPTLTHIKYQTRSSFLGNLLSEISRSFRYRYRKYVSKIILSLGPVRRNDVGIRHSSGGNLKMRDG